MELRQVIIVNKDLGMKCGKIAAQCCHGVTIYMDAVMMSHIDEPLYNRYLTWKETMTKVVKKATYREILEIMHVLDTENIKYYPVYDLGRTQVEPGSFTCISVEPLDEDKCNKLFGELKLL